MPNFRNRHAASRYSISPQIAQDNTDTDATEQSLRTFTLKGTKTLRVGKFLLFCGIGALIIFILALIAITFLWFGRDTNPYWQEIVREDRTAQLVTISTLAIRIAVATHAGLAVAMLACISVEWRDGVLLRQLPAIRHPVCSTGAHFLATRLLEKPKSPSIYNGSLSGMHKLDIPIHVDHLTLGCPVWNCARPHNRA